MGTVAADIPWQILMVDDDEDDYLLVREMLSGAKRQKFNLRWVNTYAAARAALRSEVFHAVLMDYDLGAYNGMDLIREMVQEHCPGAFILFTGRGSEEIDLEAMQAGASMYLIKGETSALMLERGIRYAIERKQSELTLAAQQAQLEAIIEAQQDVVLLYDAGKNVRRANRAFQDNFGFDPLGLHLSDIIRRVDCRSLDGRPIEIDQQPTPQALLGKKVTGLRFLVRAPDGSDRVVETSSSPLWEGGHITGSVTVWHDITELKKTEQALAAAQQQTTQEKNLLQAVMQAMPVGMAITNARGGSVQFNPAFEKVWAGSRPVESFNDYGVYRAWWQDSGHPVLPEEWASAQALLTGESVLGQILEIQRFDGSRGVVINSASPVLGADGQVLGSAVAIQDITELKRVEEALRANEATLRGFLDAAKESFWLFDPNGIIRMGNSTALARLKRPAHEVIGRPFRELIPPELAQARQARIDEVVVSGQPVEFEDVRAGINFLHSFYPVFDEHHQVIHVAAFSRDISELKRREKELDRINRVLIASNKELENFALVASHDLQEPLRKIENFANLIARQAGPALGETQRDYLGRMQKASERMRKMIEALLALSRVTTQGQPFCQVDLQQVAQAVTDDLQVLIHQVGGAVVIETLPTIQADPQQMQQLFQNLIGNALKFHQPQLAPLVRVSSALISNQWVEITVEDNGIGFDPVQSERIFQPFVRLHGQSEYEGNGVGLSICQKIVDRHNGTITAHSSPGAGSQFIIKLPL